MYCFRCGHQLPSGVTNCPICDTPQKRRQRSRQRLLVGLFIFLSGAIVGSLVDSYLFKGKALNHTILEPISANFDKVANNDSAALIPTMATTTYLHQAINSLDASKSSIIPPLFSSNQQSSSSDQILATPPSDSHLQQVVTIASIASTPPATSVSLIHLAPSAPIEATISATLSANSQLTQLATSTVTFTTLPDFKLELESVSELENSGEINYHGSLSPDGQTLIFVSNRSEKGKTGNLQCFFRGVAPQSQAELAFSWPGHVWTPEFLPDGRYIVFSSDSQKPEHIFLFDRQTSTSRQLTKGTSKNMMPAVSPDGRFIAFVSNRRGNNDIWIMKIDDETLIQITSGPEDDREPRWWPDGKSLVFTRIKEKFKDSQIMRIFLEPLGSPQPLVAGGMRNWLADPSPDGRYLAFVRSKKTDGSGNAIFVRRLDSGSEIKIESPGLSECYRPIWTHDMSGLIFHAERGNNKNLYLAHFRRISVN